MNANGPLTLAEKHKLELTQQPMKLSLCNHASHLLLFPYPSLEHQEKIVCTLKDYEIDRTGSSLWISSFALSSALIKQISFCLCFRRKKTLMEKLWISFQYSIWDFVHYKVSQWAMMIKRSLHSIFVLQM